MKKVLLAIGALCVIFGILVICAGSIMYTAKGGSFMSFSFWGFGSAELVNEQTIDSSVLNMIRISYKSENMVLYLTDGDDIIVREYLRNKSEGAKAVITQNAGELDIKSGKRYYSIFSWGWGIGERIEIYIPQSYAQKLQVDLSSGNLKSDDNFVLEALEVSVNSGNINMNSVTANVITASASSGNITFNCAQGTVAMKANSGNIRVQGGDGDGTFQVSSGNVVVENRTGIIYMKANSGELKAIQIKGGGNFSTTSGNIHAKFLEVTGDITANASSGNISLTIPQNSTFVFTADVSSGTIKTSFEDRLSYNKKGSYATGTVGGGSDISIETHATSGNVKVLYE